MAKFSALPKRNQILLIKSHMYNIIDAILENNEALINTYKLDKDLTLKIKGKLQTYIKKDCICGMCLDAGLFKMVPDEFGPIIEVIKEKLNRENQ